MFYGYEVSRQGGTRLFQYFYIANLLPQRLRFSSKNIDFKVPPVHSRVKPLLSVLTKKFWKNL